MRPTWMLARFGAFLSLGGCAAAYHQVSGMFVRRIDRVGWLAVGVCLALAAAGCESGGRAEVGGTAIESLAGTRAGVNGARSAVAETQRALDQLEETASKGGNVPGAYRKLAKADDELRKAAGRVKAQAADMRENGQAYITSWEEEMGQVTWPESRSTAADRKEAVGANYDLIASAARSVRDAYDAYEEDLTDIRQELGNDTTEPGLQSIQGLVATAKERGTVLQQRLDVQSGLIDRVYAGMTGKPPPE